MLHARIASVNSESLVDERDSKGGADTVGSKAAFKKLFIVDIQFARDVGGLTGAAALAAYTLPRHCSWTS
jgi:hypothetical protein